MTYSTGQWGDQLSGTTYDAVGNPLTYIGGSVKYRNLYQDAEWMPIVFVHYHPTGGDSTAFSGGDLQLASEHQVGLCVINRDGATAQNFKKLYERNDKPFYLKSWDNIWDYIEWED